MNRILSDAFKLQKNGEMIAFVGAGGKTTTMFALADELKSRGKRVLVTTTTAIFNPTEGYDYHFLGDMERSFQPEKATITVFGEKILANKLRGPGPMKLDEIWRSKIFDFILIEADGSKRKSIKAPRIGEPIIPNETTKTIGLIGMDSLGKKINDENVHRAELFLRVVDKKTEDILEETDIVKLVMHPQGLFKDSVGEKILILNKCTGDRLALIENIKEILIEMGLENILIANINRREFY